VFRVAAHDAPAALASLVERERAGYAMLRVSAVGDDGVVRSAVAFTATAANEWWAGPRCWRARAVVVAGGDGEDGRGDAGSRGDGSVADADTAADDDDNDDDELVYCDGCATCDGGGGGDGSPPPAASGMAAASTPRHYGITQVARVVLSARGPSGSNAEYVTRLRDALAERGVRDRHLERIQTAMCRLADKEGSAGGRGA
jgi:cation transport regulator ChaC